MCKQLNIVLIFMVILFVLCFFLNSKTNFFSELKDKLDMLKDLIIISMSVSTKESLIQFLCAPLDVYYFYRATLCVARS